MKVAVTGATGFVGRHVVEALAARRVAPVVAVRTPGAVPTWLASRAGRVVPLDMRDIAGEAFEALGRPDVVFHLAWGGLPNYTSLHHFEDELPVQYRFLAGLVRAGAPKLVVTGTCFEYGMASGSLTEARDPKPTNPYGAAKDMLRCQLQYLQKAHPFALVWARLFYMYGEGQASNALISQLARAIARGDTFFNMSGGEQLRDYLPVETVARTLVELGLAEGDIGVVNVCSGKPVSVRGFVETWLRTHGHTIALNLGHYPYPDHEPMAFWGDRERLDACLARAGAGL